jgi:hypothetical protein
MADIVIHADSGVEPVGASKESCVACRIVMHSAPGERCGRCVREGRPPRTPAPEPNDAAVRIVEEIRADKAALARLDVQAAFARAGWKIRACDDGTYKAVSLLHRKTVRAHTLDELLSKLKSGLHHIS